MVVVAVVVVLIVIMNELKKLGKLKFKRKKIDTEISQHTHTNNQTHNHHIRTTTINNQIPI